MSVCAYCGHTLAEHAGVRCWGEAPALGGGWRSCRCTTFREAHELPPIEIVAETPAVPLPTPLHGDWGG